MNLLQCELYASKYLYFFRNQSIKEFVPVMIAVDHIKSLALPSDYFKKQITHLASGCDVEWKERFRTHWTSVKYFWIAC